MRVEESRERRHTSDSNAARLTIDRRSRGRWPWLLLDPRSPRDDGVRAARRQPAV
jgi:hypothetical protein